MSGSMRVVDNSPDAYLASLPDEHRDSMTSVDRTIQRALPDRQRVLWQGVFWGGTHQSIIGYGHIDQTAHRGIPSSGSSSASLARRGTTASTSTLRSTTPTWPTAMPIASER